MRRLLPLFSLCVGLVGLAPTHAASQEALIPFAPKIELKDGDTFIFLGDSITHQCLYTQYVETYFYTRYPSKRIHFRNAGVSGDQADNALLRFDEEVSAFKPQYVSILIGMNDGWYRHFDHEIFSKYEKGMSELLEKVGQFAEAIPMGPSYFDSRSVLMNEHAASWVKTREAMRDYYPSVLGFFSEWVAEQAQLAGVNFVDMASPMQRITFEQRRSAPEFTMVRDAVHPEPKGHVVMATAMLADAFVVEPVSTISLSIDGRNRFESEAASGLIENLSFKKGRLSFDYKATALPWVLPNDAAEGYELSHAGERFSQDLLTVAGLKNGVYELTIDLVPIATFTDAELEVGVDLQPFAHSPQTKQALEVARLNQERNETAVKPMRDLWLHRKRVLRGEERWLAEHPDDAEYAARKSAYDAEMASFYAQLEELEALSLEFENRIYEANQPNVRRYVLTRVSH